ncbi:MAG: Uma2 family endonuclease [Dehalococcoidia bacterium]|nr:Uma2 family endonuclease [Dehalococcoidia bacterium]MSQ17057.1 Uma2 family endonuclease [Dehalococcoidia bacterium]
MTTKTKRLTYDAYLAIPETKQRYDIVDGVLVMAPAPTTMHQWFAMEISRRLSNFVIEHDLGVVLAAPVDLLIQRAPLLVRQPDVLFLSAERTGITGPSQLRGMPVLEVPPDLVVEVLSPSNTRRDIEDKLEDYQRAGLRECWLVSPEAETVEMLRLSTDELTVVRIVGVDGTLESEAINGFALRLRDIFRQA